MKIDAIFLSQSSTDYLHGLTHKAIRTCVSQATEGNDLNIIVNEATRNFQKDGVPLTLIKQRGKFNFNREHNRAAKKGDGKFIVFCNNDIEFTGGWDSIFEWMEENQINVASPYCPIMHRHEFKMMPDKVRRGNKVRKLFSGWCFVFRRAFYEQIGGFRENFPGHYSDNEILEQLNEFGEYNYLCPYSKVIHLGSKTSKQLSSSEMARQIWGKKKDFLKMYPKTKQKV